MATNLARIIIRRLSSGLHVALAPDGLYVRDAKRRGAWHGPVPYTVALTQYPEHPLPDPLITAMEATS